MNETSMRVNHQLEYLYSKY